MKHPEIIVPEIWEQVQKALEGGAARMRGTKRQATRSPLVGKLFDETGDRLTPSHSRKSGKRLRSYISRRWVTDRSRQHPDAWRIKADQAEDLVSGLVRQHLGRPNAAALIVQDVVAVELPDTSARSGGCREDASCIALVERADLRPGALTPRLDLHAVAQLADCHPDKINSDKLTIDAPFRTRRRGVELKLQLGDAPPEIDRTLIRNIVKASRWLAMIIDGKTFTEIAKAEGTSKRRVQDIVDLAMHAPEILDAIAKGEPPEGLTSEYLIKTGLPAIWSEQRQQSAEL